MSVRNLSKNEETVQSCHRDYLLRRKEATENGRTSKENWRALDVKVPGMYIEKTPPWLDTSWMFVSASHLIHVPVASVVPSVCILVLVIIYLADRLGGF